jgi:hypothetical protein
MVEPDNARESAPELADRVRRLVRYAHAGGAPEAWIDETAAALVDLVLEVAAYRAGDRDPRRQRTLSLAQRVARARTAGATIPQLCERFDRSRASIHRLLSHDIARQQRADVASVHPQEYADARAND